MDNREDTASSAFKSYKFFNFFFYNSRFMVPRIFLSVIALLSPKLKREESKAYHLPSFRAGVRKVWSCTSILSHIFMGQCLFTPGDNFNLFRFFLLCIGQV